MNARKKKLDPDNINIDLDIQWDGNTPKFIFSSRTPGVVYPDGALDLRSAPPNVQLTISLISRGDETFASPTIAILNHQDKPSGGCPGADDKGKNVFKFKGAGLGLSNGDKTFKMTDKNQGHELFSYVLWFDSPVKGHFPCDPIIINR